MITVAPGASLYDAVSLLIKVNQQHKQAFLKSKLSGIFFSEQDPPATCDRPRQWQRALHPQPEAPPQVTCNGFACFLFSPTKQFFFVKQYF